MAVYILIHGAWHGAWCWENVIPALEAAGHQVIAPNLPGHGADTTPILTITLQSYVNKIGEILEGIAEPAILVGHSFAGIVIAQTAEYWSKKIRQLVFIAAFLPKNNDSMFSLAQQQPPTRFSKMMRVNEKENTFEFPIGAMRDFAYQQCSVELMARLAPLFCIEPLAPCVTPVALTASHFGQVPKVYIECTQDNAITLAAQQQMHQALPCQQVYRLPADHSPFYSHPDSLNSLLLSLAN